jgi:16S rRNA (cytosine967-C5)-methyltransferase
LIASTPVAGQPARALAHAWLTAVLERQRPLDEVIAAKPGQLEARDRAFARLLTATVLRRLGQIDDALDRCLDKPLPPALGWIGQVLRLGAAQLLFLGTPPHAAVDGAVRQVGDRPALKGLVNAVLRRLAREGAAILAGQDAARLNTPDWLWASWTSTFGEATTRAIAAAHLADPPLDLTPAASDCPGDVLPTGTRRLRETANVETLPGYQAGGFLVQDAAAALPARLLAVRRGDTVLDLCAAPGGKTANLALAGAKVIAVDHSAKRLEQASENLRRLRLSAQTIAADATEWRPSTPATHILLDAPCSATGTMRRHPDVARLKRADDLPRLVALQDRLLDSAAAMLAPGGVLVFCTCSLQPEEGPARVAALLQRTPGLMREPVQPRELDGKAELIDSAGDLRTLPCHWEALGGLDGFYAARLKKSVDATASG